MRIFKTAIYVVSVAFFLGACASNKPIFNVQNAQIASTKPLEANQVRAAIITAGAALGWEIREVKAGLLEGILKLRNHAAVVDIPYSATAYSITYKSSVNLDEKGGQIHNNYNGWILNLDRGIRGALSAI